MKHMYKQHRLIHTVISNPQKSMSISWCVCLPQTVVSVATTDREDEQQLASAYKHHRAFWVNISVRLPPIRQE